VSRQRILHLLNFPLSMGGIQRQIEDLAQQMRGWADTYVACYGHASASIEGVEVYGSHERINVEAYVESIQPDLFHLHYPDEWALKIVGNRPRVVTIHSWAGNQKAQPNQIPICGPLPGVIRHGVDLDLFKPRARAHDQFTIGIVGRRHYDKLPGSFIDLLKKWDSRGARIIQVGAGSPTMPGYRETAERLKALPFVTVLDDRPHSALPEMYAGFDVLLNPAPIESVCYSAIEAMACGVPVVARATGGLTETVGDAGLLCAEEAGLLPAVERLQADPELRATLGARGRARAERLFDLRRMERDYALVYARASNGVVRAPKSGLDCSVVCPVYNTQAQWLRPSIQSVLDQQGVTFELIIVNDGSTAKETNDILYEFACSDPRVRLLSLPHIGQSEVRNEGNRAALSELIVIHDSDDISKPGRLAEQVQYMRGHPDVTMIAGQIRMECRQGKVSALSLDHSRRIWEQGWTIAHPTTCYRRLPILRLGGYDPKHEACDDFDLWCRIDYAGYKIEVLPNLWARYCERPGQITKCMPVSDLHHKTQDRYRVLYQKQREAMRSVTAN